MKYEEHTTEDLAYYLGLVRQLDELDELYLESICYQYKENQELVEELLKQHGDIQNIFPIIFYAVIFPNIELINKKPIGVMSSPRWLTESMEHEIKRRFAEKLGDELPKKEATNKRTKI